MADEWEKQKIKINPSTELLPDEFDAAEPSSVHIFRIGQDEATSTSLASSLKSCSSSKKIEINQYPMETRKSVEAKLDQIANANYSKNSCMMLFMLGRTKEVSQMGVLLAEKDEEPIKIDKVWSKFICNDSLRKKPKIFVFQATEIQQDQGSISTDSLKVGDCMLDFPLEADIFITLKNLNHTDKGMFIKSISERIAQYAHKDDILDITMQINNTYDYKVPRIISTLTRKFYFKYAPLRGYRHDLIEQIKSIESELKSVEETLQNCNIKSGELISRTSSLQNMNNHPRSPRERRNSVTPPYRPRTNSKTLKPWRP